MSIDQLLDQTSQKFIRPYLFLVSCNINGIAVVTPGDTISHSVLVKTATLPSTTIGNIEIPYQGRKVNMPGDRAVPADMAMTVIYNQTNNIHKKFHDAMNALQGSENTGISAFNLIDNVMEIGVGDPTSPNTILQSYKLFGVIPTSIGAVEVSHETVDALLTFDATIQYSYHEFTGGG
jgi:hypothetical protein